MHAMSMAFACTFNLTSRVVSVVDDEEETAADSLPVVEDENAALATDEASEIAKLVAGFIPTMPME